MRINRSSRNRLAKYFLRKWYDLDSNISDLNEVEKVHIKILYGALKQLTVDERKFLADKYRVARKPFKTDRVLADEYEMSYQAYVYKRQKIEEKLSPFIHELNEKYEKELSKAITLVNGKPRTKSEETRKREHREFMKMIEERARKRYELMKSVETK